MFISIVLDMLVIAVSVGLFSNGSWMVKAIFSNKKNGMDIRINNGISIKLFNYVN